jgi:hypothetical protein
VKEINATNRWQLVRMCGGALGGALLASQCGVLCRLLRRIDRAAPKPNGSLKGEPETRRGRLAAENSGRSQEAMVAQRPVHLCAPWPALRGGAINGGSISGVVRLSVRD